MGESDQNGKRARRTNPKKAMPIDETEVQAKAAKAVDKVVSASALTRRLQYYLSEDCYNSFDEFVESMMSYAYNRYTEDQIRQQCVRDTFESYREGDIFRLQHRIRMEEICPSANN